MGLRHYLPSTGRFLSTDPVAGGSRNAYEYVCGDPVNSFNLDGRCRTIRWLWSSACRPSGSYREVAHAYIALAACVIPGTFYKGGRGGSAWGQAGWKVSKRVAKIGWKGCRATGASAAHESVAKSGETVGPRPSAATGTISRRQADSGVTAPTTGERGDTTPCVPSSTSGTADCRGPHVVVSPADGTGRGESFKPVGATAHRRPSVPSVRSSTSMFGTPARSGARPVKLELT